MMKTGIKPGLNTGVFNITVIGVMSKVDDIGPIESWRSKTIKPSVSLNN